MEEKVKLIGDVSWLRQALFVVLGLGAYFAWLLISLWYDCYTGVILVDGEPRSWNDFITAV